MAQAQASGRDLAREIYRAGRIALIKRQAGKNSLIDFIQRTKKDYRVAPHHRLIASYLEQVERGEIDRLMIFSPPRHGKSEIVSRRFPAWYLGRNPDKQIIAASYNSDLAGDFGRDVRNLVADPIYHGIFGVSLRQDSKAADRWNTQNGGAYIAAGVGSGITGRGAHVGVIDDPIKDRKEAASLTIRDNIWHWYTSTFYTRLMPGAAVILMMTRWHEDDLAGRLIRAMGTGGDQWVVLSLPAIAEGADALGRVEGEALWPEWYSVDGLKRIKEAIGSSEWAALYQQRPSIEGGNLFKREWWQYYRDPSNYEYIIQSWDTAFKAGEENDYSVCTTWGVIGNMIDLIDRFHGRLEMPELKRAAATLGLRHRPHAILIEDKASGQSLIQELKKDTELAVIAVKTDRDKVSRAHAVTPMIEGGRVRLPEWASWLDDYLAYMSAFPKGSYDDDVDSTTQALNYLRERVSYNVYGEDDEDANDYRPSRYQGRSSVTGY